MSESETKTNKTKIKELAVLMIQAAGNPQLTDDELEHIVGGLRSVDPHALDTAANGCPG
jgi:bacteriocin-like protein